MFNRKEKNPGK